MLITWQLREQGSKGNGSSHEFKGATTWIRGKSATNVPVNNARFLDGSLNSPNFGEIYNIILTYRVYF
jgi:hypothetical protein